MTATNALSTAVLKRRYQSGVAKAQFTRFPVIDDINKRTDFDGDDHAFAIETEGPAGQGPNIPAAQAAAAQSKFYRAVITRKEWFGLVRIKGQALRTATTKGDAALVDLWTHELDAIEQRVIMYQEILSMGTGNGVLGTIASGQTGVTVTLTVAEDVNNFYVGARVQLVNDTTLSPTIRSGYGVVTAVGRSAGTITLAAAWDVTFAGATAGDSIILAETGAVGAENTVPAGMRKWLEGGASPGTWKGLTRNDNPVRLASQTLDMTGLPMAESVIDLESLIQIQGHEPRLKLICNPRDMRQVKKTLFGKVAFSSGGGSPTIGFDGAKWQGNNGTIETLQSPFCPKNNVFLKRMDKFTLHSAGPAPMPMNFGKENMITLATDDAAEARIGFYGEFAESAPVESARNGVGSGLMEKDTQILKGLGVEPRVHRGSFAFNGTGTPALSSSRYPIGFPFTVARSDTGTWVVTVPAGCGMPAQPFCIVLTPNPTAAANYFSAEVVGDSTLNTATRSFTILTHRAGTALDPTGRVGFAIHFDDSTGR